MKSTGEAMAIGRTFEESLLKALRSSEYTPGVDWSEVGDDELEADYLRTPTPDRPYAMFEAFDRGYTVEEVVELTGISEWYVERFENVAAAAAAAQDGEFDRAAETGFTDQEITAIAGGEFNDTHASWLPTGTEAATGRGDDDVAADGSGGPASTASGTSSDRRSDGVSVDDVDAGTPDRSFKQVDTCAGEFAASTPYYYSARAPAAASRSTGLDEVQVDRDVESVVIVGGGPIRIGQGVEFDYCTVHAVQALREAGIDAHVVNNNPETVSTDYDTSDGLFFEPITAEEVADVVEATGADGVMVQFGGQTSVNVGEPLEAELDRRELDCEILGTTAEAMDLAEDRDRFNALMDELDIAQPEGGAARSRQQAFELAADIGYPVLVRPSYVLGGRAMRVVYDRDELEHYIEEAVRVSPDKPILVDEFLEEAVELDVDAVSDGEDVLVGGIMEHVESAGVHSGDSACMIPPRSLGRDVNRKVRQVTEAIARGLDTVGLLNVQLAVKDEEVYVLEANPRSSRTVPFVSKATGVPIARVAAKVMAGASLEELDVEEHVPGQTSVKEVVLPFDRLPGSDPRLGPEMKSTGEVMGTADSFPKAYQKAQMAVGKPIPLEGTAVVDLSTDEFPGPRTPEGQELRAGFAQQFDLVEYEDDAAFCEAIKDGEIDLIISRRREPLEVAVEEEITYFSTPQSASAALEAIEAADEPLDVTAISRRPKMHEFWGQPKGE
jgi:carbamoyl-phosphate synthase large subunit